MKSWIPEGSLAGFLGVRFLSLAGPKGPETLSKIRGASPPTDLKAFPGPRGRPNLKMHPKNPAILPSSTRLDQEAFASAEAQTVVDRRAARRAGTSILTAFLQAVPLRGGGESKRPLLPQNQLEKVGGKPPTFSNGFCARRGPLRPPETAISGPASLRG